MFGISRWLGVLTLAGTATARSEAPLQTEVKMVSGVPVLRLDGAAVAPFLFFFNTDVQNDRGPEFLATQVSLARDHGVHLYSLPFRTVRRPDDTLDYPRANKLLEKIIVHDPDARFLLRLFLGPNWSWRDYQPWGQARAEQFAHYADGSAGPISVGAEAPRLAAESQLADIVRHYESSDYADRIIGYQPGLATTEMFHDMYREKGPDVSEANQQGFRRWLRAVYANDEALQHAWKRADITLDQAVIPTPEADRYPMHQARPGETLQVFYDPATQCDWVDFSRYANQTMADRIIAWARIIKTEAHHRKLAAFFYGYTFELPGSNSGHYALRRVLDCPDVDILASPYSYVDRGPGGTGHFMSPVDSISANGKLWFNEDDTRTSLMDLSQVTFPGFLLGARAGSLEETLGILDRNTASILVHRSGAWWMDLTASGAFADAQPWQMLEQRLALYRDLYRDPIRFSPDVAVVIDEASKEVVRDDWTVNAENLYGYRDQAGRTGAAVGYYLLSDLLEANRIPPCRAYVFPNAFQLDDEQIAVLHRRLERDKAWAMWAYAPGVWTRSGVDFHRVEAVSRMAVSVAPGHLGSRGLGAVADLAWGRQWLVSQRPVLAESEGDIIGRYRSDDAPSSAILHMGSWTSVLLGDLGIASECLRALFREAGVHIWLDDGSVVQTDGRILVIHAKGSGRKRVALPPGLRAEVLAGTLIEQGPGILVVDLPDTGTAWIRLLPLPPGP